MPVPPAAEPLEPLPAIGAWPPLVCPAPDELPPAPLAPVPLPELEPPALLGLPALPGDLPPSSGLVQAQSQIAPNTARGGRVCFTSHQCRKLGKAAQAPK